MTLSGEFLRPRLAAAPEDVTVSLRRDTDQPPSKGAESPCLRAFSLRGTAGFWASRRVNEDVDREIHSLQNGVLGGNEEARRPARIGDRDENSRQRPREAWASAIGRPQCKFVHESSLFDQARASTFRRTRRLRLPACCFGAWTALHFGDQAHCALAP